MACRRFRQALHGMFHDSILVCSPDCASLVLGLLQYMEDVGILNLPVRAVNRHWLQVASAGKSGQDRAGTKCEPARVGEHCCSNEFVLLRLSLLHRCYSESSAYNSRHNQYIDMSVVFRSNNVRLRRTQVLETIATRSYDS